VRSPDKELASLQRQQERLQRELSRQQTLVRMAQSTVGLTAAAGKRRRRPRGARSGAAGRRCGPWRRRRTWNSKAGRRRPPTPRPRRRLGCRACQLPGSLSRRIESPDTCVRFQEPFGENSCTSASSQSPEGPSIFARETAEKPDFLEKHLHYLRAVNFCIFPHFRKLGPW
jgi:hypothetical protein